MIGIRGNMLAGQEAWTGHLTELFRSLGIPDGSAADHLATSVAHYCRHYHPRGVRREELTLLLARAFCAISDRESAVRILRSTDSHARHVDRWLEILGELHHFPALLPFFTLGIIRPADWAGARLDRMWILDLGKLALSEAERHEMMLYGTLRVLLEQMYLFWDATGGEGVLGLKGLSTFSLENDRRLRGTLNGSRDLLGYIAALLGQQRSKRGWTTVPELMNLDL